MTCARPEDGSRIWRTQEAVHINVRGLEAPQPMVEILRAIDQGEAESVLIAHLDRDPIFLYPELDDRGWSHEVVDHSCGAQDREDGVTLRMVRYGA